MLSLSPDVKMKPLSLMFEESLAQSEIYIDKSDVYLKGTEGFFLIGHLQGDEAVELFTQEVPFNIKAHATMLRDKLRAYGLETMFSNTQDQAFFGRFYSQPKEQSL
jgi:hypothetical protein